MSTVVVEEEVYVDENSGSLWWVFLITGTLWLVLALIMFRFNITSVKTLGVLAGIVFLIAGAVALCMVAVVKSGWWKALNAFLAFLLILGGIFSFIHPQDTFIAIAQITAFMFLFVGIMDLIIAFSNRTGLWWLRMITGLHLHRARLLGRGRVRQEIRAADRLDRAVRPVPRDRELLHGVRAAPRPQRAEVGLVRPAGSTGSRAARGSALSP